MTSITGAANIEMVRIIAVRGALRIEIRTGMKRSNRGATTLQLANSIMGTDYKNKSAAYVALNDYIVDLGGQSRPL